jgi:hypothetical protein
MMKCDEEMEQKIRDAYHAHPWHGATSMEEEIADILDYRHSLSEEERALFDGEVARGRHPSVVVETIELACGRTMTCTLERPKHERLAKTS